MPCRNIWLADKSPIKWWSTHKSGVFGSSSLFTPFVGEGGGLVCESVGKADVLSDHFDRKQSMESVDHRSLAIHHIVLPHLPSGRMRSGVSC